MNVLWPFIKRFKQQWLMMFTGLLLTCITLLAGIGLLSLSGWFLSATAVAGLTVITAQTFNYFTPAGGVRFFSIMRTASRYGERLTTHQATFKLLTQLRIWVWQKLLPLSAENLQGFRQGDMLNRLVADIDTLDHLYLRLLTPMAASLVMTLGLGLFLSWFDGQLALLLMAILLSCWCIVPLVFYQLGKQPGEQLIQLKQQFRVQWLDVIQGQAELILFNAIGRYNLQLTAFQQQLFISQTSMAWIAGLSQAVLILVNGFAVVLMLYLASHGVGDITPPGPILALMVFATMASIEMMMPIAAAFQHLSACVLSATRVQSLTNQSAAMVFNSESILSPQSGGLVLRDIGFSYPVKVPSQNQSAILQKQADSTILKGLNLTVNPGDKIAIVGKTGCGKSSLLSLINREYSPQQGNILLDGQCISSYSETALRSAITVVSQRVYVFSATLRDNLILALNYNPNEAITAHDQRLISVLEQVGLQTLLTGESPLDGWIGEGGRLLSGGEQRRIGVARALLRDTPLLLLDEPTEGLDKQTERDILNLLLNHASHSATCKTVIMITHRLTALDKMDKIYRLVDGALTPY